MVRAVFDSDIEPLGVRMVAAAMAFHANEQDGEAWPSHGTLAAECRMHRDTVRHAVKHLVRHGVLEIVARGSGGGQRATTRYRFSASWVTETGGRRTPGPRKPGVESASDRGSTDPRPGVDGPPKRDERKPTVSLSSKPARDAEAGQPARCRPSRPDDAAAVVRLVPKNTNSQQPAIKGNSQQPGARPDWLATAATIIQKGRDLGVGAFNEATEPAGPGSAWGRYQLRVMKAAGHIKPQPPGRRESRA